MYLYDAGRGSLGPAPDARIAESPIDGIPCIYGRWCGPGCSGPGAPIDSVDTCCRTHDGCYARRGYFDCQCDRDLLRCIAPQRSIWNPRGRAAWAVWGAFRPKVAACDALNR